MKKMLATSALVAMASWALAGTAGAQVGVPPGQEFYATPMNKGEPMMMQPSRVTPMAPEAKPMMKKRMSKRMMKKRM